MPRRAVLERLGGVLGRLGAVLRRLGGLTFDYTFENLCQGGSWDGSGGLLADPGTAPGGSGPDFWSIFDHFWKV